MSDPDSVEGISRDEMIRQFGEPGVQNPQTLDLIRSDTDTGEVVLVMREARPWEPDEARLRQLEEKIDRYLSYAVDGFLARHYPKYAGRRVRIQLDCVEPPGDFENPFLRFAIRTCETHGVRFVVNPEGPTEET